MSASARWGARLVARFVPALLLAGLVVPAVSVAAAADPAAADRGAHETIRPVIDANFADPDVLLVDGTYYAYATNTDGQNIQLQTSRDLRSWVPQPDVLPTLGAWTGPCSFTPGGATDNCVWAPHVSAMPSGFALYYTAHDATSGRQCIGVATSTSPKGPFAPVGAGPLVCPSGARGTQDLGGAIDAATYYEDGQNYLLWKTDGNCCAGKTAIIYLQPLSADGTSLTGPPREMIRRDRANEGNVVEAPNLIKHDDTYYLFYSANDFYGGAYRTDYATAPSLNGPWTKAPTDLMTTDRFAGDVRGPGGEAIFTNRDGGLSLAFHGWDPSYTYRGMYVSDLTFSPAGKPAVTAASTRYEAENGTLTDARVVSDPSASGVAKVGGMDHPDSSVTVQVQADHNGPVTLGVRFANGSLDAANNPVQSSDTLTVNGSSKQALTFAHTGWGNWQTLEARVPLTRGLNTVTITRGAYYAEIDAVDAYAARPSITVMGPPAAAVLPTGTVFEAEKGVLTDARVVQDFTASGGAKIGGLDNPDSSVTIGVYADRPGRRDLAVIYGNGSERGGWPIESSQTLTVNGGQARTLTYATTRWENWTSLTESVVLKTGWNTVTLTHGTFYAELDAVVLLPR